MTVYEGIPIEESRLFLHAIFSAVLAVIAIGMVLFCIVYLFCFREKGISKKEKRRMEKLITHAEMDGWAKKELERRRKKEAHRKKAARSEWIEKGVILFLSVGVCLWCLLGLTMPAWLDYCRKDYAIYAGEFEVSYSSRRQWIELDDGEDLMGSDLSDGIYTGSVVYAKRSKIVLATIHDKTQ